MRGKFWISSILAAAIGAALLPLSTFAQPTPASAAEPLQQSLSVLGDARASAEARTAAAKKLVALRTQASRDEIANILADGRFPQSQVAVANALADEPDPDPTFIPPLLTMLTTPGLPGLTAAQAVSIYKTGEHRALLQKLIDLANGAAGVKSEAARPNATLALGQMVDREAAQTLINLLTSPQENETVRQNASKALAAMSGDSRIGDDPQGWQRWWANQPQDPVAFRNDLLSAQSVQLSIVKRQVSDLESDYSKFLNETYHSIQDVDTRGKRLLQYLSSAEPIQRAEGARIIYEDKKNGLPLPPLEEAQKHLEQMISDPSPTVRLAVADAISVLNDRNALPLLVAQLGQETDPAVKASIARALGQIGDIKAVANLLPLLDDTHDVVAAAAARALASFGSHLQNLPRPVASQAAKQLRIIFDRATPGTPLREAMISAMAELRDDTLLRVFKDVLNDPNENAQMKIKAINGIGNLKDQGSADDIGNALRDASPDVRQAAATALPLVNGVSYARRLADMLQPGADEPGVQDQAWTAFQAFIPSLDNDDLQNYADRFGRDKQYDKQVACLQQICDNFRKPDTKSPADLALALQNLGEAMMKLDPPDYDDAVTQFDAAITALSGDRNIKPNNVRMVSLHRLRLLATLRSGKYADAINFAQQAMANGSLDSSDVGPAIKDEVERLRRDGAQNAPLLNQALKLITESERIELSGPNRGLLNELKTQIQQQIKQNPGAGFTTPGPTRIESIIGAMARR